MLELVSKFTIAGNEVQLECKMDGVDVYKVLYHNLFYFVIDGRVVGSQEVGGMDVEIDFKREY